MFPIDQVREGAFFWTDEGSSEEDAINLYGFVWDGQTPGSHAFESLMRQAVREIDAHITQKG